MTAGTQQWYGVPASLPFPLPALSGSFAADMTPEESELRSLLQMTGLRQLQHVTPGADTVQAVKERSLNARSWWARMEPACSYLAAEDRQAVLTAVHVDAVFIEWPDARLFTEELRAAPDLPAFLVHCHSDNRRTADALREALQPQPPSSPRWPQQLQAESALFSLRDSWKEFKQAPTVFHACRFYSYWRQLQLRSLREERSGSTPISGPLTAGEFYAAQAAVPVCRSAIERRIAALQGPRAQPPPWNVVNNLGGSVQMNSPGAHSAIATGNTAAVNAAFNVSGRDTTVAGGNVDSRGANSGNVIVKAGQLCAITSLLAPIRGDGRAHGRVTAAFQPEAELDEASAEVIRQCVTQEGRGDHNLLALGFCLSLRRVMSSVVLLSGVVKLEPYEPGFDPLSITDEFIGRYEKDFALGTAFIIAAGLLLTNYHVLPVAAAAKHEETTVCFDFDGDDGDSKQGERRCPTGVLRPDEFFFSDRELDFAVVAFRYPDDEYVDAAAASPVLKDSSRRPPLLLRKSPVLSSSDSRLAIVGHPEGKPKQLSMPGVLLRSGAAQPQFCLYTNDTQRGSSGSPILDMRWQLVGLHHSALRDYRGLLQMLSGQPALYNQGSLASAIFEKLLELYLSWQQQPAAHSSQERELLRSCLAQDTALASATKAKLKPLSK